MTKYYGVSAPLGSGKTTAAIEHAGYAALAGEKVAIAQPSIRLINQSVEQFCRRWPKLPVRAIHSDSCSNVSHELAAHTKASSGGEVMFLTHATLIQAPYWDRRQDWHLIVDEAPSVIFNTELRLADNHQVILPALDMEPFNIRYSRLIPGDAALLERIAENKNRDMVSELFQELAQKMVSHRWDMFVLNEQWERFQSGETTDGRLLVFGLADPMIFNGFSGVIFMSANLEQTLAYQHLVQAGHEFRQHTGISNRLRYRKHENGHLLTIHYSMEDGNWSKHRRDAVVSLRDKDFSVHDLVIAGTLEIFGDQPFVWLANKDIENDLFAEAESVRLPHSPHGLNSFQHIHNAAVLPALNPTPSFYAFLEEVAHLNADEVRRAVYHEAAYQAAGRISLRNPDDVTPKHLVVADHGAAQAIAELFPGAAIRRLPYSDLIPQARVPGRKRIHSTDAAKSKQYRDHKKADLLRQLYHINGVSSDTKSPIYLKDISCRTSAAFGGSLFADIRRSDPASNLSGLAPADFIEFLRDLHRRNVAKADAWLWSPAEFERQPGVETGRGLENITAIHGVWMDNDGGDLTPEEFAAMFPYLIMVIHNSSSSTPDRQKWRAIIPTTCSMTIEVHAEILLQIRQALNRRGFYDKKQLEKRAAKGVGGKCHGFDPSKYNAASMFYLPTQALAGPDASFFMVFNDGNRKAINPYQWIDKTIINHRPEPEHQIAASQPNMPPSSTRKDPKLTRLLVLMETEKQEKARDSYEEHIDTAIQRWRGHLRGTGNEEFFRLAVNLRSAGMVPSEIQRTLYNEAGYAHGQSSQRDRRAAVPAIMRKLRCAA